MSTVLVIEDETALRHLVRDYLDRSGYRVITAATAAAGSQRLLADEPDLIVLDLGLPDGNGLDILRTLRRTSGLPVIILTARGDEVDRIVGLELGADDYMVKPFSPGELVARVRAVLRRVAAPDIEAEVLERGALVIDIARMRVTLSDTPVDLTSTEFQLLAAMARQPGRVFTRAQLLKAIHGSMAEAYDRAIDAHIKNIRRKLDDSGHHAQVILTVHGVGYRFSDAA
jgi:two-component system alkaline phosphatase synthesis response regulator PhoP